MKPGAGKRKGSKFEREICKLLSLWVTTGKRKDVFWRSAMSGGRATVHRGEVRQAGDICSVSAEGHSLTDRYYIECRHYRDFGFVPFVLNNGGKLGRWWSDVIDRAAFFDRLPMLVAKQSGMPTIVLLKGAENWGMMPRLSSSVSFGLAGSSWSLYLLSDILGSFYDPDNISNSRPALKREPAGRVQVQLSRKAAEAARALLGGEIVNPRRSNRGKGSA